MNSVLKGFIRGEAGGHLGLMRGEIGEQDGDNKGEGTGQRDVNELDPLDQPVCKPYLFTCIVH